MGRLEGKVAVITGAGSGIGLATAQAFAREGARLVLVGRNNKALADIASEIGPARARAVVADVTTPAANERMVAEAVERFGGLDILVANAGIEGVNATIDAYPVDVFDQVIAINLRGVFLGLKCAIPAMRARGGGSVVILSSIGGIRGRGQGNSAYIASKHAVIGLMKTAALEGAAHGIRVNCVLPGPVETRMIRSIEESRSPGAPEVARAALLAGLPMKRYGTPEEVANVILFLASAESSLCTGSTFSADGGLAAG
ncbi:MAG: SDR family NAD(P)-dependent oxidoreductase [Betaproteobacteria bacterium]